MIEFGAGGTLVHSESEPAPPVVPAEAPATGDGTSPAGDGANATDGANANAEVTVVPPILPMPAPPTTRRKRKAKGWFCPVCRQRKLLSAPILICRSSLLYSLHRHASHHDSRSNASGQGDRQSLVRRECIRR